MRTATALIGSAVDRGPLRLLPNIGEPLRGGFYAGRFKLNGLVYALIVSPKGSGEASLTAKTTASTTSGTISSIDGAANTAAMIAAGADLHPAARFCEGLSIGGYTDWFLPAKDQLEVCFRNLKPGSDNNNTSSGANSNSDPAGAAYTSSSPAQTPSARFLLVFSTQTPGPEMFARSAPHWTSTTAAAAQSTQVFTTGEQATANKTSTYFVRAVRAVQYIG